ncbi:uncharacterized protein LOC143231826 isoform X2 [Tachypleus tridentatus]|uniref:uncharacterized protein LOC143231826 isoform X2 n=1 Tax=Tachypleus tridentatus TaxID=6853 RepID=UPI003FD26EDB
MLMSHLPGTIEYWASSSLYQIKIRRVFLLVIFVWKRKMSSSSFMKTRDSNPALLLLGIAIPVLQLKCIVRNHAGRFMARYTPHSSTQYRTSCRASRLFGTH